MGFCRVLISSAIMTVTSLFSAGTMWKQTRGTRSGIQQEILETIQKMAGILDAAERCPIGGTDERGRGTGDPEEN